MIVEIYIYICQNKAMHDIKTKKSDGKIEYSKQIVRDVYCFVYILFQILYSVRISYQHSHQSFQVQTQNKGKIVLDADKGIPKFFIN